MLTDDNNYKLNVLYRGMAFSGGAPKSAYYYLSYFKKKGAHITTLSSLVETKIYNLYLNSFNDVIVCDNPVSLLNNHHFLKLYIQMKKEYKFLKRVKPDLVIIQGHLNALFYAPMCNCLNIRNIMLIAGGDLSKSSLLLSHSPADHVICFSEENKEVLIDYFNNERITVISNRIQLKCVFEDLNSHYSIKENQPINILLTSRVSNDKYASIVSFIETINKTSVSLGMSISLTIAGDGDKFEHLKKIVSDIKNHNLQITIKGHVDDLIPEFEKAHIVVGKGRSVVEPIMMNRIGCVIGDDGKVEVCSKSNFVRLYHYNFSGRKLSCDNPVECMEKLLSKLMLSEYDLIDVEEASKLVRRYYSSEFLENIFKDVLNNLVPFERKHKHVSVLFLIIKLLWYKIKQRKVNQKDNNEKS